MSIPFLTDEAIESRADQFLQQYHPEKTPPVPIEVIVEADLGIEIFPIPGFESRFGIAGYISNDLKTLTVDEGHMVKVPARYRFTLAHEIGHYLLHADYIRTAFPGNEQDWKRLLLQTDRRLYTRLEIQANRMAGAILVPRGALSIAWDEAKRYAAQRGFDVETLDEFLINHLAAFIARDFQVSDKTVEIALQRYRLI